MTTAKNLPNDDDLHGLDISTILILSWSGVSILSISFVVVRKLRHMRKNRSSFGTESGTFVSRTQTVTEIIAMKDRVNRNN